MGALLTLGDAYVAQSVITDAIKTQVVNGIADMQATVTELVGLSIPATIVVVGLTAGVKYAIKTVKGVIANAS